MSNNRAVNQPEAVSCSPLVIASTDSEAQNGPLLRSAEILNHDTTYIRTPGQTFADSERHGVLFDGAQRALGTPIGRDLKRYKPKGWPDVETYLVKHLGDTSELEEAKKFIRYVAPERRLNKLRLHRGLWEDLIWKLETKRQADGKVWMTGDEIGECLAALMWKEGEDLARKSEDQCGTTTFEFSGKSLRTGENQTQLSRMVCSSRRCGSCARCIHAARDAARVLLGWEAIRADGDWMWFLTLTVSWDAWFEKQGLTWLSLNAKRNVAWKAIGRMTSRLKEQFQREGIDWPKMVARKFEKHDSAFPHVHLLISASDSPDGTDLGAHALRSAGCANTLELQVMLDAHKVKDDARLAAWERGGRKGRKGAGYIRIPHSKTKKKLEAIGKRAGFGFVDAKPVDERTIGTAKGISLYFAKDPTSNRGDRTPIPDTGAIGPEGEYAKANQVEGALPRKVRITRFDGWPSLVPMENSDPMDRDTMTVAIHRATVEQVEERSRRCGYTITGKELTADFSGPIPEKGGKRPTQLNSFVLEMDHPGLTVREDGLVQPRTPSTQPRVPIDGPADERTGIGLHLVPDLVEDDSNPEMIPY